jgi:RHS repeat-associated protein
MGHPAGLLAEVPGTQTGVPVYRMTDHLGSLVGTLSSTGAVLSTQDVAPFGEIFAGGSTDPYLFTGKERDAESGNDYFGARFYSSNMGRFMSPDWATGAEPIPYSRLDDPQTLNLYAYVRNNPSSHLDADGHLPEQGNSNGWLDLFNNLWQRVDNVTHGLGFHTDAQVETMVHDANLALRKNGVNTEGLKDSQVLGLAAAGRPTAAQARAIYENATGQKVPFDEQLGRYYDMHHKTPIADGGAPRDPNNLEPLQHEEHVKLHQRNNDFSRWNEKVGPAAAGAEEESITETVIDTMEILNDLDDVP